MTTSSSAESELAPDRLLAGAVATERRVVDAVEHRRDRVAAGAVPDQLAPDVLETAITLGNRASTRLSSG